MNAFRLSPVPPAPPVSSSWLQRGEWLCRLAFWPALLTALVFACLPAAEAPQLLAWDKAQHVLAFTVLTALAALGYPRLNPVALGLGLSGFGLLIELVQLIPSLNRSGEPADWVADSIAIAVTLLLCRLLRAGLARIA